MKAIATTIAIIVCVLTFAAWYLSPHLAVYRVLGAAQDHDIERLSTLLDQGSIKANIGVAIKGQIDRRVIESVRHLPLGELSLMAAERAIDAVLDELVSPNTVGNLLRGQKLSILSRTAPAIKADTIKPEVHWGYERDHDHFAISVRSRLNSDEGTRFVFFRYGWIGGWRIVAIEFSDVRDIISIIE